MATFGGFPPETIRFLRELRANNTKDWFDAHRADYEAYWVAPAKAFVIALRINRDTRFSRDPSPYKDHLDFWFWEGERRDAVSGFFARLSPEFLGVGAGCHSLDPERLTRFRRAVAHPASGEELARIAKLVEGGGYELGGAALRRPPAGLPADGPAGRFLLHKALFVHHDEPVDDRVHTTAILATCARHWQAMAPLHRWLTDHVQVA
jgi:uncharacterized protein (TIGR02453 family)